MVIKSLEYPVYNRKSNSGLSGESRKDSRVVSANYAKTFEEAICDLFSGEIVQDGSKVSPTLSDMTRRNLNKIK